MRRLIGWGTIAGLAACLLRPTLAAITPDFGYADGCTNVELSGHHLGVNATARLEGDGGTAEFTVTAAEEDPAPRPDHAQPVGFSYLAEMPPSPDGLKGWYDVVLEVEGGELRIRDGWYYIACPATFVVDDATFPETLAAGGEIAFVGCG